MAKAPWQGRQAFQLVDESATADGLERGSRKAGLAIMQSTVSAGGLASGLWDWTALRRFERKSPRYRVRTALPA